MGMPGPVSRYAEEDLPDQARETAGLSVGHLLSHIQQEPTVGSSIRPISLRNLLSRPPPLSPLLPQTISSAAFALRKIGEFGRFLSVIEELVEWDFQARAIFSQRLYGWNCMAVFHA